MVRTLRERHAAARRSAVVVGVQPAAPGQGNVFVRVLRAILRMRRAMRYRQLFRPREPDELPPSFDRVEQTAKGRIYTPGLARGRIHQGGS
jgi:hypothetical protein